MFMETTQLQSIDPRTETSAQRLRETAPPLRQVALTENQQKVIRDKYLRDDPSVEIWLWRIAENIALTELLYDPLVPRQDILAGVNNELKGVDAGSGQKTELLLIHSGLGEHNARIANHRRFIGNLYQLARTNPNAQALVREWALRFYDIMASWDFLPNSPCLMNAGRELQQLSACYVLPIEDSIEGWGETLKNTLLIHQSGGGTGFSGCRVRPKGDTVKSTKGVASGSLSPFFMIDNTTQHVKQGGTRRGANMGILPCWHPDIFDFIDAKQTEGKLENFNISVAVDSNFMDAAKSDGEIDLVNPHTKLAVRKIKAKELFDKIVENAWKTGDPGVIFLDRINNSSSNPTPSLGQIESTNPCGEQPLLPYEPCNLGSLNLRNFVKDGQIDWARLGSVARIAYRFMDNVIDVNNYPLPQIEAMAKGNRRTGFGVMGWAEMLALLGIPYDSEEALTKAEEVSRFIGEQCLEVSCQLATERGVFPNFKGSAYDTESPNYRSWARGKPRNCARTTIAPTGTIAIAAGLQGGGIEPFFSIVYVRYNAKALDAIKKGEKPAESDVFYEINPIFRKVAESDGYWGLTPAELWAKIDANHKSVKGIKEVPEHIQRVFVSSHDIAVPWHVRMQAAWQKYTDNAVSKTINMPNSATVDEVRQTYLLAWETGCKGITIYRDGSKAHQVLNLATKPKDEKKEVKPETDLWGRVIPRPRPSELAGRTVGVQTPAGKMYVTINEAQNKPFELFATIGKAGSDITAMTESLARLISLSLRCGISVNEVVDQLIGIGGAHSVGFGPNKVRSVPDAMGQILASRYLNVNPAKPDGGVELVPALVNNLAMSIEPVAPLTSFQKKAQFDLCPSCGNSTVIKAEGCTKCQACGWGEC
jgi:ribonucleoside-diphosphate reductase alpha chain